MAWRLAIVGTFSAFSTAATNYLATVTDPTDNQQATAAVADSKMMAAEIYLKNGSPQGAGNVLLWNAKFAFELFGYTNANNSEITNSVFLNPHQAQSP